MLFFILTFFMGAAISPPQPAAAPPRLKYEIVNASIGTQTYRLEVAEDEIRQNIGLSFRAKMEKDCGMLFIFPRPADYEFCMVDMRFPLDFIWLKEDRVVALLENAPPTGKRRSELKGKEIIKSQSSFDKVIELNTGEIKRNGIKIGDTVTFYQE